MVVNPSIPTFFSYVTEEYKYLSLPNPFIHLPTNISQASTTYGLLYGGWNRNMRRLQFCPSRVQSSAQYSRTLVSFRWSIS